nr:histamine H4 receptor-like [Lytechinus pictus]
MEAETSTLAGITTPGSDTGPDEDTGVTAVRIVLMCLLYIPLAVITVLGNAFVFAAYRRDKRIRSKKTNMFILNLAIADLLVGIIMFIHIPHYLMDKWLLGREFCIIIWAIDFISTDMSVITIIAISIDRYLMVSDTIKYQRHQSRKRIVLIFIVVWFFCSLVHTSLAFIYSAWTDYKYLEYQTCNLEYRREKALVISMFIIEFVLPVTCLFLLNLKVFTKIQERRGSKIQLKRRKGEDRNSNTVSGRVSTKHANGQKKTPGLHSIDEDIVLTSVDGEAAFEASEDSRGFPGPSAPMVGALQEGQILRKASSAVMRVHRMTSSGRGTQKAAKLLTTLLVVFILCWLPYYINDCYVLIHDEANRQVTEAVTFILWANSAVNPMLYACANIHYRENFFYFLHIRKRPMNKMNNRR